MRAGGGVGVGIGGKKIIIFFSLFFSSLVFSLSLINLQVMFLLGWVQ
jgi:hypothetical protein